MTDLINALVLLSNFVLIPAITYGSQLALGELGITIIYGILRFANFAYGDLMAFATTFTILFTWYFQSIGISFGVLPTALLAIPFAIIVTIIFCLITDKLVFGYYRIKKSPSVTIAMVSLGVMFVTNAIVRIIIVPYQRRFDDGERLIIIGNEFKKMKGLNEGQAIKSTKVLNIVIRILVVSLLFWFLNKTKTEESMRAYSDNEDIVV